MSISVPTAACVRAFKKAVAMRIRQVAGSKASSMKLQLHANGMCYPYSPLRFYLRNEEGVMIVDASFERGATSEIWEQLLYACQHQTTTSFEWVPKNCKASIRVHGDHVTFTMAKDGGKNSISVPKAACVSAFEEAVAARRQVPDSESSDLDDSESE